MQNLIIKYPLDLRGNSPANLVTGERHQLEPGVKRLIVPFYGPFYTKGLIVRNALTGEILERERQWKAVQLYQEAVNRTGKEVCAVIVIVDESVGNLIEIDYQVVGGKFSRAVPVIKQLIDDLDIDERSVEWGAILAKPEAFPPVSHLHDAGDLYGFEYVVAALEQVREAVLVGDAAAHEEIVRYIEEQAEIARQERSMISQALAEHAGDKGNPHAVTKAQVGLGSVQNYPAANLEEAEDGVASNRYMTPETTKAAVLKFSPPPTWDKVADKPTTFPPSDHTHGIGDVTGLQAALDKKMDKVTGGIILTADQVLKMSSQLFVSTTSNLTPYITNPRHGSYAGPAVWSSDLHARGAYRRFFTLRLNEIIGGPANYNVGFYIFITGGSDDNYALRLVDIATGEVLASSGSRKNFSVFEGTVLRTVPSSGVALEATVINGSNRDYLFFSRCYFTFMGKTYELTPTSYPLYSGV